ncbi:MAG: DUF2804 family protein [Oscillospiraceae bacterium]|nr:DUF2804 family protein [Oscillospiraceae bacterium]
MQVLISFANITIGGYVAAKLVDLKTGAVYVEKFPKDRFLEPWKIISEDGSFNMTIMPTLDNHSDVDFKVGRMNCHQVFGIWNGDVTLDDGTKIEIKDLFTFCEYVENKW